ncbi:hypothetical protein C8C94_4655 [Acidovorax sp. 94]|uniref:DUF7024 domain-containing protein n=1 Tax=Acidovorax sp. 94 TaxID=2135633 RepID=UPI000F28DBCF|nr:hypothetical protein [Acidovorax sp. 94]RKR70115.1 hypothetical protein C8C94_4655 [Acidovorax sp. 94]
MNGDSLFGARFRYFIELRSVLVFIAIYYIAVYFFIPATPGNAPNDHPLGWWGWFDQGKYLLSANALSVLDLTPDKHFYPPLYSALGAIFLKWSSGHMYFVLNLLSLLWFAFVFLRFADRYVPRWGGVALLFGTTIFNYTLFENYVIPWTSTLSVALLASGFLGLVWLDEIKNGAPTRVSGLQVFFVATCIGLLVPTRPADALVGGVIGIALLIGYWTTRSECAERVPRLGDFILLSIVGASIGPLLFFGFNAIVFDSPTGGYIQAAGANGYFPADLLEKFISLWLDGFALYGEPNAGLTERYPWLFLSLAGVVWVLIRGDSLIRAVACTVVFLFIIYLPYGDLLPNGIWRYLNVHYFKWAFPFMALFAVLLVKDVLVSWRRSRGWVVPLVLLIGMPMLLLSLHFSFNLKSIPLNIEKGELNVSLNLAGEQIDFIDFKGVSGGAADIYFGAHDLILDGRKLTRVKDFRLLPMSWGVRLLFIRPIIGHSLEFYPDRKLTRLSDRLSVHLGSYRFALGALKPFRKVAQNEINTDYKIGEVIDFSVHGNGGLYATQGWSEPEAWGRWSINKEAAIQMRLNEPSNQVLELELVMGAFVGDSHPCQKIHVIFNAKEISNQSLCLGNGGEQQSSYKYLLTKELLRVDDEIDIRLITPNSVSPAALGISADDRVLGVGVRSLRISAAQK